MHGNCKETVENSRKYLNLKYLKMFSLVLRNFLIPAHGCCINAFEKILAA